MRSRQQQLAQQAEELQTTHDALHGEVAALRVAYEQECSTARDRVGDKLRRDRDYVIVDALASRLDVRVG